MLEISVQEAETKLSEIIRQVVAGEEVFITEAGEQVAKVIPVKPRHKWVGMDNGKGRVLDSFFDPLDDDETAQYLMGDKF